MIRRPPRSTLFPTRRSSDLVDAELVGQALASGPCGSARLPEARVGELPYLRTHASAIALGQCLDRKSTRLNSSHPSISYAVFCLKKKKRYRESSSREAQCSA